MTPETKALKTTPTRSAVAAVGGVGIHHLLGGDDLDLVRIAFQPIGMGDTANFRIVATEQFHVPFGTIGQSFGFALAHESFFRKSSRNTG